MHNALGANATSPPAFGEPKYDCHIDLSPPNCIAAGTKCVPHLNRHRCTAEKLASFSTVWKRATPSNTLKIPSATEEGMLSAFSKLMITEGLVLNTKFTNLKADCICLWVSPVLGHAHLK